MSQKAIQADGRVNFGKIKQVAETPDLLAIQIQSFKDFFQLETTPDKRTFEGLFRVFKENFPITDTRNIFVLEFLDYLLILPGTLLRNVWKGG
jgi:DNA-directed RNA polymerase subunit beta